MLNDFLGQTAVIIVLASWYLYVFETLSKIRKYRKLKMRDWGFGAFQPFKNLMEYKQICERNNDSLLWYKAQIYLFYAFLSLCTIPLFMMLVG